MDLGSEKNDWGQRLWWGLHLVPPEYLRWDDWKVQAYEVYDNQLKFMKEARKWQEWYFSFRSVIKVKDGEKEWYFKYVLFDLLPESEKESFNRWEMRHGAIKINPEPEKKCIYRDDFLNWIKEKMIVRYHELMAAPPKRDYKKDQAIIDAKGDLLRRFSEIFKLDQNLRVLGAVLPEKLDMDDPHGYFSFNPAEQASLHLVYDYLPDIQADASDLQKLLNRKIGKQVHLTPLLEFKDRDLLDWTLTYFRRGPEPWKTGQLFHAKEIEDL